MFLEFWKRYSAEISHRWDLTGFDIREEHPRPEYLARLSSMQDQRLNYVTKMLEPYVSFWKMKVPGLFISCISILLLVGLILDSVTHVMQLNTRSLIFVSQISLALVAVMAVILYRMSMVAALSLHGDSYVTSYAMLITTTTAASINLCCILLFNQVCSIFLDYSSSDVWHICSSILFFLPSIALQPVGHLLDRIGIAKDTIRIWW